MTPDCPRCGERWTDHGGIEEPICRSLDPSYEAAPEWVATTRQLTGAPYIHSGIVMPKGGSTRDAQRCCTARHRGRETALACAERKAKRLNRQRAAIRGAVREWTGVKP